jgi:hypothetical protein
VQERPANKDRKRRSRKAREGNPPSKGIDVKKKPNVKRCGLCSLCRGRGSGKARSRLLQDFVAIYSRNILLQAMDICGKHPLPDLYSRI